MGIDLVASGRSKALETDRQASMTHYIWRWRRTSHTHTFRAEYTHRNPEERNGERDNTISSYTIENGINAMCSIYERTHI